MHLTPFAQTLEVHQEKVRHLLLRIFHQVLGSSRLQLKQALMHYGAVREKDVVSNYENLTRFELNSLQMPFLSLLDLSFQVKALLIGWLTSFFLYPVGQEKANYAVPLQQWSMLVWHAVGQ